jgi:hypothetical protein
MKIHSPVLINYAAEMARTDQTLGYLTEEEWETFVEDYKTGWDSIRPGNLVKVTDIPGPFPASDSFWVRVTKCDGNGLFVGRVESYLFADKPYGFGDLIHFGAENILGTLEESDEEQMSLDFPADEGDQ